MNIKGQSGEFKTEKKLWKGWTKIHMPLEKEREQQRKLK
jgi:hypothetical protein